jgi:transcriptional regulator with XRE-family HTH domain
MTFAERLRELRDAKGISEAKLAQASGVTFSALHQYGLGRRKPSLAAAVKLARALGVTCEAFADCEDVALDAAEGPPAKGRPRRAAQPTRKPKAPQSRPRPGA